MKRFVINLFSMIVILSGSLILTVPTNGLLAQSPDQIKEVETRCGSCSTTDPNKCCRTKMFKRCEIYICN